jgi:hypothetical protein
MPTHLDYLVVRQRQHELARRAERVRQEREGLALAPASRERGLTRRLFMRLGLRRPAEAPASSR